MDKFLWPESFETRPISSSRTLKTNEQKIILCDRKVGMYESGSSD